MERKTDACKRNANCRLCSCAFTDDTFDAEAYARLMDGVVEFHFWTLQYTTLAPEAGRLLCGVGKCPQCGKIFCDGTLIPADKEGDGLLAAVYRWFYQRVYTHKHEYIASRDRFRAEFLKLFAEKDQTEVRDWLARPENQHISQTYKN
jgi:hypothetical protein